MLILQKNNELPNVSNNLQTANALSRMNDHFSVINVFFAVILIFHSIQALAIDETSDAPETRPPRLRTQIATEASAFFWQVFHNGLYEDIPKVQEALLAAYLQDPDDSMTSGQLGSLHLWKVSELSRLQQIPVTITDSIILGRKYLQKSIEDFSNPIFLGQLGATMISEGQIDLKDELVLSGYQTLLQSIEDWPEFSNFTGGYLASRILPPEHPIYQTMLELQWENYELCVGQKVNRDQPDFTPYLHLETNVGRTRVCWNNEIAPHNLEGFFMNMGDMLVKAGDWQTAQKIYANTQVLPSYKDWNYSDELEQRIIDAEVNVTRFNAPIDGSAGEYRPVMSNGPYSCTVCHEN